MNGKERKKALEDLDAKGIRFIRLTWVDHVNCVRCRIIPMKHFKTLVPLRDVSPELNVTNPHGGVNISKVTMGLVSITPADGVGPVGMYRYIPDLRSARLLSFAPRHAMVMGWFEEQESYVDESVHGKVSYSSDLCARTKLRHIVEEAKGTHGISFLMGFETEVIFLRSTTPIEAVNNHGWSESPAILAGSPEARVLDEIADALELADISLEMFHAESAPGQYEFVTGPLEPLAACDALVCTREIILNVCAKHGLKATMTPRIYSDNCGSASHAHLSLTSDKLSNMPITLPGDKAPSLNAYQASFLAGLLAHLPAVIAFALPTPTSYDRMQDGVWSGGTYASWDWENKEVPVRLCGVPGVTAQNSHMEIKCIDGTSSPYLVAASLLAAGMDGIKNQIQLKIERVSTNGSAASLSPEQRVAKGIITRLPLNLDQARTALARDLVFRDALGDNLIGSYLAVNKTLANYLEGGTKEEQIQRMIHRY